MKCNKNIPLMSKKEQKNNLLENKFDRHLESTVDNLQLKLKP